MRLSSSSVLSDRTSALDVSSAPPAVSCYDDHAHRSARDRTSPSARFACSRSNTHLSIDEFTTRCCASLVATALDIHHLYIYTHESIGIQSREDLVCFGLVQVLYVVVYRLNRAETRWDVEDSGLLAGHTAGRTHCHIAGCVAASVRCLKGPG